MSEERFVYVLIKETWGGELLHCYVIAVADNSDVLRQEAQMEMEREIVGLIKKSPAYGEPVIEWEHRGGCSDIWEGHSQWAKIEGPRGEWIYFIEKHRLI